MTQHSAINHAGLTGVGSVATDAIFDAKGDLAAGTGANTAAKLTVGANDTILMADSGQSTGLKWVAAATPTDQDYDDVAAAGTSDTFARGDHLHGMPSAGSGGSHGSSIDYDLGGDVSVASANTYTDAASGTPAAGTYDIFWKVTCTANGSTATGFKCILLAGATEIDYSEGHVVANERTTLNGFAFGVVLNGSTVVKTQMRANQTNTTISRNGGNGTNNDATKISLRATH